MVWWMEIWGKYTHNSTLVKDQDNLKGVKLSMRWSNVVEDPKMGYRNDENVWVKIYIYNSSWMRIQRM